MGVEHRYEAALLLAFVNQVQDVACVAPEPVKAGDDQLVAGPQEFDDGDQFGATLAEGRFARKLAEQAPCRACPISVRVGKTARAGMNNATERLERKLAAIFAADVAGYSRLMSADEAGTLRTLTAHREIMDRLIAEHGGRIANTAGDSVLAEFPSAVDAVECAVAIQAKLGTANTAKPQEAALQFRIGIHVGDVIVRGGDLLGDGVNLCARLQEIAEPGGVCLSAAATEQVRRTLRLPYKDLGLNSLKNIAEPVRAFALPAVSASNAGYGIGGGVTGAPDRPCVAVLPFSAWSDDGRLQGLADGLSEDIITELSRINSLAVLARNSTFVYKGQSIDIRRVGRELGARYVIEGSVRKAGERVRVTAQLIDVASGNHVWAERYDRDRADSFDLQDEVAGSVVASIQTQILWAEGLLFERSGNNTLNIAELSRRGWKNIYELTGESLERALETGRSMFELAPKSAKGHQLIAAASFHLTFMGFAGNPQVSSEEALTRITEAIRLDDRDEFSHWMLAATQGNLFGRLEEALAAYRQAFEINPNFSVAYGSKGLTLAHSGRPKESLQYLKRAMEMNPRDPSIFFRYSSMAVAHYLMDEHTLSVEWAQRALARKPNWWVSHAVLIASLWAMGRREAAASAAQALCQQAPLLRVGALPVVPMAQIPEFADFRKALRAAGIPK